MKVSKKELHKMISESIKNEIKESEFDPYNYSFNGMSDEEFDSLYDDEDEAEMERELVDLISDGEELFRRMRELIETSKFYSKNKENETIKKYLSKIDSITDSIKNFWR